MGRRTTQQQQQQKTDRQQTLISNDRCRSLVGWLENSQGKQESAVTKYYCNTAF